MTEQKLLVIQCAGNALLQIFGNQETKGISVREMIDDAEIIVKSDIRIVLPLEEIVWRDIMAGVLTYISTEKGEKHISDIKCFLQKNPEVYSFVNDVCRRMDEPLGCPLVLRKINSNASKQIEEAECEMA